MLSYNRTLGMSGIINSLTEEVKSQGEKVGLIDLSI